MAVLILQFLGAAAVIVLAGTFLTRYADTIGERTGLGRTLAGMVLLATATSLPELSVCCNVARWGNADMAMGNLLGSCLFNLLNLAVLDLLHRGAHRMFSRTAAAHALSAAMSIMMLAVCLLFLLAGFERTIAGVGPGPLLVVLVYLAGLRLVYFDQQSAAEVAEVPSPLGTPPPYPSLGWAIAGYLLATSAILMAAPLLGSAAEDIAERSGLGGSFVGTTLVAICTTLPELVTTLAAVRAGAFDLAVGNILGSNTFNIIILLPVDAFYDGSLLADASPIHAVTATCGILVTAVASLGFLYRAEKRYWMVEPDALLVITLVLSSLGLIYYLR